MIVKEQEKVSRRTFLDWLLGSGIFVWIAGIVIPAWTYLWPARRRGPEESMVSAGNPKDIDVGGYKMVQARGQPILVLKLSEKNIRAFSAICPHLGCIVRWDLSKKQILCPCHAGVFGPDGKVISGPPPKPLPEYQVIVTPDEVQIKL